MIRFILFFIFLSNIANAKDITAKSWIVTDNKAKIIAGENVDEVRPIASITKLITVMAVIDAKLPLDEPLEIKQKGSKVYDRVTRRQLINMTLIQSNNLAAKILCDSFPGGNKECLETMNARIRIFGMEHTRVYEPTGLDSRNVSTARDLVKLTQGSINYPEIIEASSHGNIKIKIKNRLFFFKNTNPLIGKDQQIVVSKTGWINASGGCIVMYMNTDKGKRVVVVLGSKNTHTRIPEAEFISTIQASSDEKAPEQGPFEVLPIL